MEATLVGKTIKYGAQTWQKSGSTWSVWMWGWWPGNTGYPGWRLVPIENDRVPSAVKRLG